MNPYEARTERHWFVQDRRDVVRGYDSEREAREAAEHPNAVRVLCQDVTYGPMVEADQ